MKRRFVTRVECHYPCDKWEFVTEVVFERVDIETCNTLRHVYHRISIEKLPALSTIVNYKFSKIATLPEGWVASI